MAVQRKTSGAGRVRSRDGVAGERSSRSRRGALGTSVPGRRAARGVACWRPTDYVRFTSHTSRSSVRHSSDRRRRRSAPRQLTLALRAQMCALSPASYARIPAYLNAIIRDLPPYCLPQRRGDDAPPATSRRLAGGAAESFVTTRSIALTSRSGQCSSLHRSASESGPAGAPGFGRSTAVATADVLGRPGAIAAAVAGRPGAIAGGLAGGDETDSIAAVARERQRSSMTRLDCMTILRVLARGRSATCFPPIVRSPGGQVGLGDAGSVAQPVGFPGTGIRRACRFPRPGSRQVVFDGQGCCFRSGS